MLIINNLQSPNPVRPYSDTYNRPIRSDPIQLCSIQLFRSQTLFRTIQNYSELNRPIRSDPIQQPIQNYSELNRPIRSDPIQQPIQNPIQTF